MATAIPVAIHALGISDVPLCGEEEGSGANPTLDGSVYSSSVVTNSQQGLLRATFGWGCDGSGGVTPWNVDHVS